HITHDLLKHALTDITVTTFTNGKELIDHLRIHTDLSNTCILTDLDMPVMNGFEATHIIRNELKLTIPIIALTASVFIGDEAEFKQAGFNGMVSKPFVTIELMKAIAKTMAQ
ncbi:MAG TPA: response regulator, partial [Bacteroidia bacterium]|nr:response regulator [Bacteroidia bacterium]